MADDFDRFTPSTRRALTSAQAEAQRLNHPFLGTEHLLLGLVLANEDIACTIMTSLFNLDYYWVYEGFHLFRFWMN